MSEEENKDLGEQAKEAANDAKESVNEAFSDANPDSGKNIAIIAHITFIGWIIAMVMNNNEKKSEYASFYIRQTLGLYILLAVSSILSIIPFVGCLIILFVFVLLIISFVNALGGKTKPIFLLGEQFQDWFKSL